MKVHRAWLQKYFDAPLPSAEVLADRLTFRAFEIEDVQGDLLDVKVLPDRAAYALSHRGIAYELSAILNIPLKQDPLREKLPEFPKTSELVITTDPAYVLRHTGAIVKGVKVGPSPAWLVDALQSVGQRSINNVVDVLNYVTLDIGQPTGAFDLTTLKSENGVTKVDVRRAKAGEKIKVLTGEEYTLTDSMFVFTDAVSGGLLDIAGIKGGLVSGVTEKTTGLFLSVGTYDPVLLRRTAQSLKLFTDASQRYQNGPSPELTRYGMHTLLKLIPEVAGGTVVGVVDEYRTKRENVPVSVTRAEIVARLGRDVTTAEIHDVLGRLGLLVTEHGEALTVTAPFERSDIAIPEDVTEEVGRILGYENLESKVFPETGASVDQRLYRGLEKIKDYLLQRGFSELSTQSFVEKGEVKLANPLDVTRPFLRTSVVENLQIALKKNMTLAPLLGIHDKMLVYEIGKVYLGGQEYFALGLGYAELGGGWDQKFLEAVESELQTEFGSATFDRIQTNNFKPFTLELKININEVEKFGEHKPTRYQLDEFSPFSSYPFVLRDIALWVPEGTTPDAVLSVIRETGTALLVRTDLFDTFAKAGRTSYAFRLVFQSTERTLTDDEVGTIMAKMAEALAANGWEVR